MEHLIKALSVSALLALVIATILFVQKASADEGSEASNRIDFGNSYVQGQSIKSGAVYLMNRKKNEISSMLKKREHYRTEILAEYPEFREEAEEDEWAESENTASSSAKSAVLKTN